MEKQARRHESEIENSRTLLKRSTRAQFLIKRLRCKDSLKNAFGAHVFKEKKKKTERNIVN